MKKESKPPLPISLKSIEIENFAGILHTGLKDLPGDAQWIFLTGENGFGKTSVLRGIAVGVLIKEAQNLAITDIKTKIKISLSGNLVNPFWDLDLTGIGLSQYKNCDFIKIWY